MLTKEEYILKCDVLLGKLYYKSDAPWIIDVKVEKNLENDTNRLLFSWIRVGSQHRVFLYAYDSPTELEPGWEHEQWVTITDVMSFMKEPEDYRFAIQCILSSETFYEDLVDGFEPMYLRDLEELVKGEYLFI